MSDNYPQDMVDSGVSWLGQIPKQWELKKVKRLFKIQKRIIGDEGPDILSITQSGIKKKDTKSGDGQLAQNYSKYQIVEVGDFAMNHMDLLTGYIDVSPFYGVTSPDYRVFTLTAKEQVPKYYLYIFQQCYKQRIFFPLGRGSSQLGRWRLPSEVFNSFILPVPPYQTQIKIVSYIDRETARIDILIAEQERLLALLEEKRRATITHAVRPTGDTTEERFRDICVLNPATRSDFKDDDIVGFYPMESIGDDGTIDHSQTRPYLVVKTGYTIFQNGDITVAKVTPCFENYKGAHMTGIASDVGFGTTELFVLRANGKVTPEYLYWLTQAQDFNNYLTGSMRGTGGLKRVVPEDLKNYKVDIPAPEIQKKIVFKLQEDLKKFELLKQKAVKQVDLLKERRTSLILSAITGKAKV